jgi:hypothetical protein
MYAPVIFRAVSLRWFALIWALSACDDGNVSDTNADAEPAESPAQDGSASEAEAGLAESGAGEGGVVGEDSGPGASDSGPGGRDAGSDLDARAVPLDADAAAGALDSGGDARVADSGGDARSADDAMSQCTPNCAGRMCGSNGCGSTCGTCSAGQSCNASGQCASPARSFAADVFPIFMAAGCPECHDPDTPSADLVLASASTAYENLVDVAADCAPTRMYVAPGSPETSYLINKLTGAAPICGQRMPRNRTPLTNAQIDIVRVWISGGAVR